MEASGRANGLLICLNFTLMDHTQLQTYKPLLFTIAYNFLGSIVEAEDVVQEVFLKVLEKDLSQIQNLKYYLTKATSNTCLKRYQQLKKERENYIGPWLPEPIIERENEWDHRLDRSLLLELGTLKLLENLNPIERGVWILRTLIEWDYDSIADVLQLTAANCRQIKGRAAEKIGKVSTKKTSIDTTQIASFFATLQTALQTETYEPLINRLKSDAILYSDGGGKVAAALKPLFGPKKIVKFMVGLYQLNDGEFNTEVVQINGVPAVLVYQGDQLASTFSVGMEDEQCAWIAFVRNPEKISAGFVTN